MTGWAGVRDGPGPPDGVEVGKSRTRWLVPTYSRVVPGASGRVLVVDDNKVIRQLIRVNLELEGLEVVTAADGAECLDVVHRVRPDVVTLDVVMPRLDGLRTAARLRADPRTRELPLAIISACTQVEVESGLDVGVDAFLAKPFEPAELVRLVKQLIERKPGPSGHGEGDGEEEGDSDGDSGSGGNGGAGEGGGGDKGLGGDGVTGGPVAGSVSFGG
ncbi:response regulator [Streptomyces sp. NPDC056580]|uniref:response regulator n=1 Tax=Streptomyces sp. NPDC056580 TaxID=3345872 RepID=UPI00369BE5A3